MRPPAYNRGMSDPVSQRPTRIRVDLDALSHNLRAIRAHVRVPVMAIIKANAYGHGLLPVALHLQSQGVEQLGVAFVEEGIALRRAGVTVPILVLGGIFGRQVAQFIAHDLEVTVSSLDKLRQVEAAAEAMGRKAVVHLKIDTGMERIGVHSYSCAAFIESACASPWCEIKGIYSHLACADDPAAHRTIDLRPTLSLVSQVVYFKVVKAGHPVSYGATWKSERDTRVVTIPIGYGDGFSRALSSRGAVLIRGERHPIVGRICMDQFMVDLGPDEVAHNEDEVVLIGTQDGEAIRTEDVARLAGTIPYEILTGLNERIPREYRGG